MNLVTVHSNSEVILKTEIVRNTVRFLCGCNIRRICPCLILWLLSENDQYIMNPPQHIVESLNCKCAGLIPIVTTTMPVVDVHCVRHNTCHVTYTVTSPMCTRAERLTRAVESLAVHMGIQTDLCMRSEDLIFTG